MPTLHIKIVWEHSPPKEKHALPPQFPVLTGLLRWKAIEKFSKEIGVFG